LHDALINREISRRRCWCGIALSFAPGRELALGHIDVERAPVHVDDDAVAVLDERQRTADSRLR
jgi:hypothetical protein